MASNKRCCFIVATTNLQSQTEIARELIEALPNLIELDVSGNGIKVTDAVLKKVAEMSPNLPLLNCDDESQNDGAKLDGDCDKTAKC